MKAFVISIPGHQDSQLHADNCIQSVEDTNSELDIEKFTAIVPETMWQVDWKWPYTKKKVCPTTGMTLKAYKTYDMSNVLRPQVVIINYGKRVLSLMKLL